MKNRLYYGDNLDVLRSLDAESVDLIYLDPPFNSNRNYNVLFKEKSGEDSPSQIEAFTDTWAWNQDAKYAYRELTTSPNQKVASMIEAMHGFIGANDMLAYLVMMAQRMVELHRVLKPTGSIYLHCDPTASHYLKMLMDAVFRIRNYRSEISWRRSSAHNDTAQGLANYGHIRDEILFYTKTADYTWNPIYEPYDESYISSFYKHVEPDTGRRYRLSDLTAAKGGRDTSYLWKGMPPYKGRFWAYSRANLERFEEQGRLHYASTGMPSYKRYLDEMPGVALQDDWSGIRPAQKGERLGYPTQKPLALLERIIEASSNPGDVVLDPFCGCGTAIAAAQKLGRRWIGIDITHLAINLIKTRMVDHFGPEILDDMETIGQPTDVGGAEALFNQDPFQFEWWAVLLAGAYPANDMKKGADKGVDGVVRFHVDNSGKARKAVVQLKGGKVQSSHIRDLKGAMQREKADIGIFVTLRPATKDMEKEALDSEIYQTPTGHVYPAIQILTIGELLAGKKPKLPSTHSTFSKAERIRKPDAVQQGLEIE